MTHADARTAQQRDDVDMKYRNIYASLANLAGAIVSDLSLSNSHKYKQLKTFVPSCWGLIFQPDRGSFGGSELAARCVAYNAEPTAWFEKGVPRAGTHGEFNRALDNLVIEAVRQHHDPHSELVLDLGCGWGHRMFDIWRAGLMTSAKYRGGDRSDDSRKLVEDISGLFPGMDAGWFPFDFLNPDFDCLPDDPRRICVLTCHAIEQVNYLGPALFDALIARFPKARITGIHLEPITFQFGDDYPAPSYVNGVTDRAIAEERRYNMDLYAVVKAHPKLSIIGVEQALMDLGSGNSTSLLTWRSN